MEIPTIRMDHHLHSMRIMACHRLKVSEYGMVPLCMMWKAQLGPPSPLLFCRSTVLPGTYRRRGRGTCRQVVLRHRPYPSVFDPSVIVINVIGDWALVLNERRRGNNETTRRVYHRRKLTVWLVWINGDVRVSLPLSVAVRKSRRWKTSPPPRCRQKSVDGLFEGLQAVQRPVFCPFSFCKDPPTRITYFSTVFSGLFLLSSHIGLLDSRAPETPVVISRYKEGSTSYTVDRTHHVPADFFDFFSPAPAPSARTCLS